MNTQTIETMMSSANSHWNTPHKLLDVVYSFDAIGLDPCSNTNSIVVAVKHLCGQGVDDDGLTADWLNQGLVYVNPPYGSTIKRWTEKCAIESFNGAEIIALLPSRTDTKWWHQHVITAQALCFWKGRFKFLGAKSCAPFPSVVAYWGVRQYKFAGAFQKHGMVTILPTIMNKSVHAINL